MIVVFPYRSIPVFVPFHQSVERDRWVVGGYGSGKSTSACAEAQKIGMEQPGMEWLVMRKTVPALRDTTEKTFVNLLPTDFLKQCDIGKAGGHLEHITFPNGTTFYFRSCDDWKKHRSMNLAGVLWDEADEFSLEDYEGINSRLRQVEPTRIAKDQGAPNIRWRGHIFAANPQGHNWLWEMFCGPNRKSKTQYWTSSSLDNPFLPLDYIDSLLAMPDPWVRRYVLCNFDEFAGAIYPEWSRERHFIEADPQQWLKENRNGTTYHVQGFDPGTSAGNAASWCHYNPATGVYVATAEYLKTGLAASEHARSWKRLELEQRMRVLDRPADPKAITVRDRGSNLSLLRQYQALGFHFRPGVNDVNDRLNALGELIHLNRFRVLSNCPDTFEQIANYRYEDLTPSMIEKGRVAKPLKKNVDLVDAVQYIATRLTRVAAVEPEPLDDLTPQEAQAKQVWASIQKQLRRSRTATSQHDLGSISV